MATRLGIQDAEQWLEDCPRRVFDNWRAQYIVAPFGDEQTLLAKILAAIYLLILRGGSDLQEIDKAVNGIMPAFMPAGWADEDDKPTGDSIANFEKIAKAWRQPSTLIP